ncbi:Molybdenum-pterin-binding protein MopA (fragment) [Thiomonas sp. X19]|uniref:TOBE domain-containing protein n=1 Tax=Thiomonas sp. X19 TaxID=1050370 RepID=UPI000B66E839
MRTSARNVLHGTIEVVTPGAVNAEVVLRLPGGERLVAIITLDSMRRLGLEPNTLAWAMIKASWPILCTPQDCTKTSARNRLCGQVSRIVPGVVNDEISIELSGGGELVVMITPASTRHLGLQHGLHVCALIKASHIILGVDD